MGNCDLCNTTIGDSAKRYSPNTVRTVVRNGLRPDTYGPMGGLAAALGRNLNQGWVQMVMADTTDWALCPACASRLESYLHPASQPRQQPSDSLLQSHKFYKPSGPPLRSRKFYGQTVDEAKAAAQAAGIPPGKVKELKVTRTVRDDTVKGEGPDAAAAINAAKGRVPSAAFDVGAAEVFATGEKGQLEIKAQSEGEARNDWRIEAPPGASLDACECQVAPKSGFLGIGQRLGIWRMGWSTPFRAKVSYKLPAEVTLTYQE